MEPPQQEAPMSSCVLRLQRSLIARSPLRRHRNRRRKKRRRHPTLSLVGWMWQSCNAGTLLVPERRHQRHPLQMARAVVPAAKMPSGRIGRRALGTTGRPGWKSFFSLSVHIYIYISLSLSLSLSLYVYTHICTHIFICI